MENGSTEHSSFSEVVANEPTISFLKEKPYIKGIVQYYQLRHGTLLARIPIPYYVFEALSSYRIRNKTLSVFWIYKLLRHIPAIFGAYVFTFEDEFKPFKEEHMVIDHQNHFFVYIAGSERSVEYSLKLIAACCIVCKKEVIEYKGTIPSSVDFQSFYAKLSTLTYELTKAFVDHYAPKGFCDEAGYAKALTDCYIFPNKCLPDGEYWLPDLPAAQADEEYYDFDIVYGQLQGIKIKHVLNEMTQGALYPKRA